MTTTEIVKVDMHLEKNAFVADFEGMMKGAEEYAARFDVLSIVTEDDRKKAKKIAADLRAKGKEIDESRIALGKTYEAPKREFDADCKKVIGVFTAKAAEVDVKISKKDAEFLEARTNLLAGEYEETAPDLMKLIPLETFTSRETKLLGRTWKGNHACNMLDEMVVKAVEERKMLADSGLEFLASADKTYCETLDVSRALAENKRLSDEKKALEEHQKAAAELRVKVENNAPSALDVAVARAGNVIRASQAAPQPSPETQKPPSKENIFIWEMKISATKNQAVLIKDYVKEIGARGVSLKGVLADG